LDKTVHTKHGRESRAKLTLDLQEILSERKPAELEKQVSGSFNRNELEMARDLALEVKKRLGPRRISERHLPYMVRRLVEVSKEGSGVLVLGKRIVDLLPASELSQGAFDRIACGTSVKGLIPGLKAERGVGHSLIYTPTGEHWSADNITVYHVLRGLLEKRGFSLNFSWDYQNPKIREDARKAMASYLESSEDLLLNLPTIPIDRKVLREVVSNVDAWPQLKAKHALRDDPLIESKKQRGLFYRDWTKLHSGSFKDRAALVETALCLAVCKESGKPAVGLMATTGNMGASFAETVWLATHKPDGSPLYPPEQAVSVLLYGTTFNPAKKRRMLAHGAKIMEGFGTFNQAFDSLKTAIWTPPVKGAIPVWCGDTPMRVEASKVFAYELALDLVKRDESQKAQVIEYLKTGNPEHEGRRILNDVVGKLTAVLQVGNGINYAGMASGFTEMQKLGIIDSQPELIPVQPERALDIKQVHDIAASSNPAGMLQKIGLSARDGRVTYADGIDCLLPVAGHMVYQHYGRPSQKVSDEEIAKARLQLSQQEGIECEPAGAAGQAALMQEGMLSKLLANGRTVVAFITGSKKD